MTTLHEQRKAKIERTVRGTFNLIKLFDPDLYGYALRVASKLDEEDWQQQAQDAMDRRVRLNGRQSRYAS
jgi:hypothetical protein